MFDSNEDVAIIGGGIAGMAMALALNSLSIPCTVYEMRASQLAPRTAGGGMMICPNALGILDSLGVYDRLVPKGYPFEYVYYKDPQEKTVDRYPLGGKDAFGYKAMRIFRQELLDSLYAVCAEKGIPVEFEKKFSRIVEETAEGVRFELTDGTTRSASLLIGADGIHSKVRNTYVSPDVKPKFVGLAAVTYAVASAQLRIPEEKDYKFPVTVPSTRGAFVLAPQKSDGSEMLAGTQFPFEERAQEEWAALLKDKDALKGMLQSNIDTWPDIVQSALENIDASSLNVWPFYLLPRLDHWTSLPHRRVVILGDAAHALPPTTGQGASQAFEDVQALALLVAKLRENSNLKWEDALAFWQKMRQDRIQDVVALTQKLNNKRLPSDKMALLSKDELWSEESPDQMAWLYVPKIEEKVEAWAQGQTEN